MLVRCVVLIFSLVTSLVLYPVVVNGLRRKQGRLSGRTGFSLVVGLRVVVVTQNGRNSKYIYFSLIDDKTR